MGLLPTLASDDGRTGVVDAAVNTARTLSDEFEEYESGELDSDSSDSFTWHEGWARRADAWVSPGRAELTERLLFAFIEPSVPMAEVNAFIRSALRSVAPLLPVDLLPSSRGAMILRCESAVERDSLLLLSPITGEGAPLVQPFLPHSDMACLHGRRRLPH
jgi:hypothetical protein